MILKDINETANSLRLDKIQFIDFKNNQINMRYLIPVKQKILGKYVIINEGRTFVISKDDLNIILERLERAIK